MGRSDFGGGDEVVDGGASGMGVEPQSAEGLGIYGPYMTHKRYLM